MTIPDWDYDLAVGEIDLTAHTGLILAEDAALKTYLTGITVPDREGMVPVDVWFRYPEGERRMKYPFITIDFLAINPSYDRWTSIHQVHEDSAYFLDPESAAVVSRGMYIPSTAAELPEREEGEENTGYHIDPYLMYTLTYQVTVHTRSALHDRYLLSRFMTDIFPPRPFFIGVDADATWRRCELLSMQQADITETTESGNKRIFRKAFTITMDAEIPQSKLYLVPLVQRLHADIYADSDYDAEAGLRETPGHDYDDPHTIGVPVTVEPPPG